jgi:hypothetical protein
VALIDLHPVTIALAANANTASNTPVYLRRSSYASPASRGFTVSADGVQQTLELLSVSDLDRAGLQGADDAFMLQFSGPGTEKIEQGTHVMSHPTLGSFELFSTPVNQPQSTQTYAIVVDRSIAIESSEAPTPSAAATDSTAVSSDSARTTARSTHKPAPVAHESIFHRVRVARATHGVLVEVFFAPNSHIEHVHAWLIRNSHPLGVADHRVSGNGAKFEVSSSHHLPDGHYEIKLIATARHGVKSGLTRQVTLT